MIFPGIFTNSKGGTLGSAPGGWGIVISPYTEDFLLGPFGSYKWCHGGLLEKSLSRRGNNDFWTYMVNSENRSLVGEITILGHIFEVFSQTARGVPCLFVVAPFLGLEAVHENHQIALC